VKIARNRVAVLDYTLTGDDGQIIDESHDGSFGYLHGAGNIIPGLERALDGREAGETLRVSIEAVDAYGERDLGRIQRVPRNLFPAGVELAAGMRFEARSREGHGSIVTLAGIDGEDVIIDANHPLAGQRLHFEVTVLSVRSARKEEIAHGHVHGPGGHDH
jgi:FKBP-type peptidyl-prolyl cis-trans isomerase SlyD